MIYLLLFLASTMFLYGVIWVSGGIWVEPDDEPEVIAEYEKKTQLGIILFFSSLMLFACVFYQHDHWISVILLSASVYGLYGIRKEME